MFEIMWKERIKIINKLTIQIKRNVSLKVILLLSEFRG